MYVTFGRIFSFAICRRSNSKLEWLAECGIGEFGAECVWKWSEDVLTIEHHQSPPRFVFLPSMIGPLSININISAEIRLQANCVHPHEASSFGLSPSSSFKKKKNLCHARLPLFQFEDCAYNKLIINALINAKMNNNNRSWFFSHFWQILTWVLPARSSFHFIWIWISVRFLVRAWFRFGFWFDSFLRRVKWKQKFKTRFRAYFWLIYAFDLNSPRCWLDSDSTEFCLQNTLFRLGITLM